MKETKLNGETSSYSSPEVEVLHFDAEKVFADSGNSWYSGESNDANIGWSYSNDESWD